MVVTRSLKNFLIFFAVLVSQVQQAFAQMLEKGKTKVKTVFNIYHQNSNDGHQVYDNSGREEVNAIEPMVFIEHQIDENTAIDVRYTLDAWTAASDTKIDGQTGASGSGITNQARNSVDAGVRHEKGSYTFGGKLGFSKEYDYKSLNVGFDVAKSMAKDNFVLGLGVQYYKDKVSVFEDLSNPAGAKMTFDLPRNILATTLSASQILTRKDIVEFSYTFVKADKNLESTANSILLNGVRSVEVMPDERVRHAFTSKWVHGLSDTSAMNLSYRAYTDDWGVNAHTIRGAYLFELNDEEDFIEVHGRFYDQGQADFYKDSFSRVETHMTSDSELAKYSSYEVGAFYKKHLADKKVKKFDLSNMHLSHSLVYSIRTNGLRYGYYQMGFGVEF